MIFKRILIKSSLVIAIIFAMTLQFSCSQKDSPFNSTDSLSFNGRITDFTPGKSDSYVIVTLTDLDGSTKDKEFLIDRNGFFKGKVYQPFKGDVLLSYEHQSTPVWLEPNSQTVIDIIRNKSKDSILQKYNFIATGNLADINNLIFNFQDINKKIIMGNAKIVSNVNQVDGTFIKNRKRRLQHELNLLDQYVHSQPIKNHLYETWQRNELIYKCAKDIVIYPFFGKPNRNISNKEFLSFLDGIPISNESAFSNSSYYVFLRFLAKGNQIMLFKNEGNRKKMLSAGFNWLPVQLDALDKISDGIVRELLYYDSYPTESSESAVLNWPRFYSSINNEFISQKLKQKRLIASSEMKPYSISDGIQKANANVELKKKLLGMFSVKGDSLLYIDYWGDWCIPCMKEMPIYPTFISSLKGKRIKFIFLSVLTTNTNMQQVKVKNKIDGVFLNLSNDEASILRSVFQFQSYPSHFLLDHKGNVISNKLAHLLNKNDSEFNLHIINQFVKH